MGNREWLEKELEDWLMTDPVVILDAIFGPGHERSKCRLIGRQVRCAVGVMDLLISYGMMLYIVELKAVKATEEAVGQITRYRENLLDVIVAGVLKQVTDEQCNRFAYVDGPSDQNVHCIVIAPSFTPQAILTCAQMGHILEVSVDNDGQFHLSIPSIKLPEREANSRLDDMLKDYYIDFLAGKEAYLDHIDDLRFREIVGDL